MLKIKVWFHRVARPFRPKQAALAALFALAWPALAAESTVVRIGARTEIVSAPKYGVDLGVIDQHRKVDCSFTVTNRNWRERKVLGVRGNCACLETEVEQKTLARGEALPVKVVFNPAGMEGPVEKLVTLRLEGKEIEYPVKADVRLRLGFRPSDLNFGVVAAGGGHAGRVTLPGGRARAPREPLTARIAGYAATNAALTLVAPSKPFFDVSLSNGVLTAAFRAGTRFPGMYSEIWQVKTSDPELPVLKVPVAARVAGGLAVAPQVLTVPSEGGLQSRQALIRAISGGAFRVLAAETKPRKWGDVKIVKRPLNGWLIRVDNIDPVAVRQFSKKPYLAVTTDYPGMETFEIPLRLPPPPSRTSASVSSRKKPAASVKALKLAVFGTES